MYPHIIKDDGIDSYYDLYKRSFGAKDVDYEKLFELFATEYKDKYPPTGAYIGELASRCLKQEVVQAQKWLNVKVYNPIYKRVTNSDCFPAGTSEEKMLATYKKMFPNTEGWQIVEVY
jgi:hypothetical protein